MTRIISVGASVLAVALLVTVTASHLSAQGTTVNKRAFLTFSRTVQVPGATLPAGTYVFRIADPASQQVWQVLDAKERNLLAQFFYVSSPNRTVQEANAAHGRPVVRLYETPQGVPPAIRFIYYPSDLSGSELLYPENQARQLAAATHQPVLATDSDAKKTTLLRIMRIEPQTARANNSAPPVETARLAQHHSGPQTSNDESRPVATEGIGPQRPVATSGRYEPQSAVPSRQTAEPSRPNELPKTASLLPLVAWIGLLALTSGLVVGTRNLPKHP